MRIGVTGHRNLDAIERVERGIDRALDAIAQAFGDDALTVVSPLAEGADRLIVRRVLARKPDARLVVPLPLPREEYVKDFGTAESMHEFTSLIAAAHEVVTVPPAASRHGGYEAAGRWVLDRCDVLVAVWDGNPENETGKLVVEAQRRQRPLAWVHANNGNPASSQAATPAVEQGVVTFEGFSPPKPRLVLHVGVTGYRQTELAGCDVAAIRDAIGEILDRLRRCVEQVGARQRALFGSRPPLLRLFSRLADGADLIAAEVALERGWELHCPLPFDRDVYEASLDEAWRGRYRAVLAAATRVLELDGEIPTAGKDPSGAYFESRRMVLRHSDVLIAVWNPDAAPSSLWGTTRLVTEARNDGLLVAHVDPRTPRDHHVDARGADTAIHRDTPEMLEAETRTMLALGEQQMSRYRAFLAERDHVSTLGFVWLAFRNVLLDGRPGTLRLRIAGSRLRTRAKAAELWDAKPRVPDHVRDAVDGVLVAPYAWVDTLADHYAHLTRSSIVLNYLLAAGAVAMALAAYGLGWTDHHHPRHGWAIAWTVLELAMIALIVATTRIGNGQRWHGRWMDYRILAERLRLQRTLAPLGRLTPDTRRPAHLSFGDVRGTWVGWYFRAFARELGMIGGRQDVESVAAARAAVVHLLRTAPEPQIPWHAGNAARCHTVDHRLHVIGTSLFGATAVACALHLVAHWPWLTFVSATFPAWGASMGAIAMHLQLDRIHKHSVAMSQRLAYLCDYLERQPATSSEIAKPCEEIAECMTTEVLDWRSLFRGTIALPA